jgi:hypothetical protein
MIDITHPDHAVEISYRNGVLWVNVDGICKLRVCQIEPKLLTTDILHNKTP